MYADVGRAPLAMGDAHMEKAPAELFAKVFWHQCRIAMSRGSGYEEYATWQWSCLKFSSSLLLSTFTTAAREERDSLQF